MIDDRRNVGSPCRVRTPRLPSGRLRVNVAEAHTWNGTCHAAGASVSSSRRGPSGPAGIDDGRNERLRDERDDALRPDVSRLVESIVTLSDQSLAIRLRSQRPDMPLSAADVHRIEGILPAQRS